MPWASDGRPRAFARPTRSSPIACVRRPAATAERGPSMRGIREAMKPAAGSSRLHARHRSIDLRRFKSEARNRRSHHSSGAIPPPHPNRCYKQTPRNQPTLPVAPRWLLAHSSTFRTILAAPLPGAYARRSPEQRARIKSVAAWVAESAATTNRSARSANAARTREPPCS
jgi:hypothetical protein